MHRSTLAGLVAAIAFAGSVSTVFTQAPAPPSAPAAAPQGRGNQPPPVNSQEVLADRKITFRIYAPQAQSVRLSAGDVGNIGDAAQLKKGENGIWETTVGPVEP